MTRVVRSGASAQCHSGLRARVVTRVAVAALVVVALASTAYAGASCSQTFTGSITASDPSHLGYLLSGGGPSVCGPQPACPGMVTQVPFHYDTYSLNNPTGSPVCVTVTVNASACGSGSSGLAAYAYLGSFNPADLCTNYAGGVSQIAVGSAATYHLTVP